VEARLCNHCFHEKAILMAYSECVFKALGIQHAVFCNIFTLGMILEEIIEYKICVLIFSAKFEKLLIPRRTEY
jgi:hypothetical protein